jgi:hypothetical protein
MMQVRNYIHKPKPIDMLDKDIKAKYEKDLATFGTAKYNRFNVYKKNFNDEEPLGVCDFLDDDEEEIDDEIVNSTDDDSVDELDLMEEKVEPPKKKFAFKIKKKVEPPKKVMFGKQECQRCGKGCFTPICAKCQLEASN